MRNSEVFKCNKLPSYKIFDKKSAKRNIKKIIDYSRLPGYETLLSYTISMVPYSREIILFETLLYFIRLSKSMVGWDLKLKTSFLKILNVCPKVSKLRDQNNQLLIHHLIDNDCFNIEIIVKLIKSNPMSPSQFANTKHGRLTPLHLLFFLDDINLKLIGFMIDICPNSTKCATGNGEFPIHLFLKQKGEEIIEQEEEASNLLILLANTFPDAVFWEQKEQIIRLSFGSNQNRNNESNEFVSLIDKSTNYWTPYEKMISFKNPKVSECYERIINKKCRQRLNIK